MGLGACSVLGKQAFREPVVNLRNVQLRGVGVTGGSLDVTLTPTMRIFTSHGGRGNEGNMALDGLNVGAAFWGLVLGFAVSLLLERRDG